MDAPGRWAGGFRAWDEGGVYLASARGVEFGALLQLPADDLRGLMERSLPLSVHLIRGVFGTARSIESTVRQRESLYTLGTLAAGLAHELNNPAAAAVRTVDAMAEACDSLLSSLGGSPAARSVPNSSSTSTSCGSRVIAGPPREGHGAQ